MKDIIIAFQPTTRKSFPTLRAVHAPVSVSVLARAPGRRGGRRREARVRPLCIRPRAGLSCIRACLNAPEEPVYQRSSEEGMFADSFVV